MITAADAFGSMTEDAGPTLVVNGGFETGDLTGWTASGPRSSTQFVATRRRIRQLRRQTCTGGTGSLEQDVATTAGTALYAELLRRGRSRVPAATRSPRSGTARRSGADGISGGFTKYTFRRRRRRLDHPHVAHSTYRRRRHSACCSTRSRLVADAGSGDRDGRRDHLASPMSRPADTHTASFTPHDSGYVGTFSLDPVSGIGRQRLGGLAFHGR